MDMFTSSRTSFLNVVRFRTSIVKIEFSNLSAENDKVITEKVEASEMAKEKEGAIGMESPTKPTASKIEIDDVAGDTVTSDTSTSDTAPRASVHTLIP
ncbi:hypothetical protein NL676_024394 [Syzygium grande]|nr:hypothetical protein NL676_024394 [Syzygium grande]